MFSVNTRSDSTLDANVPAGDEGKITPAFVTDQSLTTFAFMSAVVQMIWQAFQNAAGPWADSHWLPLVVAGVVGLGLTAPILNSRGRPKGDWVKAIVFASLNVCVLWAAALGVDSQLN